MRAGRREWFLMPPHFTPPDEQKPSVGVIATIRAHVAARMAFNIMRRDIATLREELEMKISELSGKVDRLIRLATDFKNAADTAAAKEQIAPVDDPEVEMLGKRIDDAIAVLMGAKEAAVTPSPADPSPPVPGIDPNAPAT